MSLIALILSINFLLLKKRKDVVTGNKTFNILFISYPLLAYSITYEYAFAKLFYKKDQQKDQKSNIS